MRRSASIIARIRSPAPPAAGAAGAVAGGTGSPVGAGRPAGRARGARRTAGAEHRRGADRGTGRVDHPGQFLRLFAANDLLELAADREEERQHRAQVSPLRVRRFQFVPERLDQRPDLVERRQPVLSLLPLVRLLDGGNRAPDLGCHEREALDRSDHLLDLGVAAGGEPTAESGRGIAGHR
jgi:hypothetical protein